MPNADAEPRLDRPLVALLAAAALVIVFFRLGEHRTFGRHEAYAAVPAREMLDTGDWLVPRFGGLPRLEKPPLQYWAIAVSSRLCGGLDEFSARLPSAVAAIALAAVVGAWGGLWYGRMAGLGAALAVVCSQFVFTYGRRAEVDMILCLLTTGAMFLIATQPADERFLRTFARWTGIYALVAVSWMAKFHYGAVMVFAPTVVWLLLERRWKTLAHLFNPLGLALMAAAVFAWRVLLLERVPEAVAVWKAETVGRVVGRLGAEPVWFYLPHVLQIALPWTPLILLATPGSLRAAWRERDPRERLLWVWFIVHLTGLSYSAGKHAHYLAATFPVFALLAGRGFAMAIGRMGAGSWRLNRRGAAALAGVSVAAACVALSVALRRWPRLEAVTWFVCPTLGLGGAAFSILLFVRADRVAAWTLVGVFLVGYVSVVGTYLPVEDKRRPTAEFADRVRTLSDGATVYAYGLGMRPAVYYLREPVRRIEDPEHVGDALERRGAIAVVTTIDQLLDLQELGDVEVIDRMVDRTRGRRVKDPPLLFAYLWRPHSGSPETRRPERIVRTALEQADD